jgi:hypothetical protein
MMALRLCFAGVIHWCAIPPAVAFSAQPHPVGLARCCDLSFLGRPAVYARCRMAAYAALLLYAVGLERVLSTSCLFLFCAAVGALRNSQGAVVHSKQIVSLVLLVQAVRYLSAAMDALWQGRSVFAAAAAADGDAVFWSQQAILATYFTAGLSKMLRSRGRWLRQVARIPLQILKTSEQFHHNELQPISLPRRTRLAEWLLRRPAATRAIFGLGLAVELAAPLFLLSETALLLGGALLFAFHRLSALLLRLHFAEAQVLVLVYLVNLPYWAAVLARTR